MSGQIDPTQTKTLRDQYARNLRAGLYRMGTEIELWFHNPANWVGDDPLPQGMHLVENALSDWSLFPKGRVLSRFKEWIKNLLGVEGVTMTSDGFISKAYDKGVDTAERQVEPTAGAIPNKLRQVFRTGTFVERLAILKTQARDKIVSLTEGLKSRVINRVAEGMIAGESPRVIGREINKTWRKISKEAATRIARTEVIRANNEGALDRMQSMGVKQIGFNVEWSATMMPNGRFEKRVCKKCRDLHGLVIPIEKAHGMLPRHPNCRCSVIPVRAQPNDRKLKAAVRRSMKRDEPKRESTKQRPRQWPGKAMEAYVKS